MFALVAAAAAGLLVVACSSSSAPATDSGSSTASGSTDSSGSTPAGTTASCGADTGKKATGTPIKLGAIVTKAPGVDFDDAPAGEKAFFDCVNANGGIGGRPIDFIVENEQIDPGQVQALGRKLISSENVVGMVGSFSVIECDVNHGYYEKSGIYSLNYGIAPSCWTTPNSIPVTIGPRFSVDGAVQALIKAGAKKIVLDEPKNSVTDFIQQGAQAVAKASGVDIQFFDDTPPIQDANSIAVKLVQAAGDGGAVLLNYVPSATLPILQAAQQQGLYSKVTWGCSLPCNNEAFAKSLGSGWEDKLIIDTDLALPSADNKDNDNYRAVMGQYASGTSLDAFSQAGYFMAKLATDRLMSIKGAITRTSFNAALKATSNYASDLLCKPFTVGSGSTHIPVNYSRTVTVKDGEVVPLSDCAPISSADPLIAAARKATTG